MGKGLVSSYLSNRIAPKRFSLAAFASLRLRSGHALRETFRDRPAREAHPTKTFVSFVVKMFLIFWLRLRCAEPFAVNTPNLKLLVAAVIPAHRKIALTAKVSDAESPRRSLKSSPA